MAMLLYIVPIVFGFASALSPCSNGTACDINCGNNPSERLQIKCADSVIDASAATTATILCSHLSACHNTTVICPIGNASSCGIICNDSLSCNNMNIYSQSMSTSVYCISSDTSHTNICQNVSVFLLDADQRNSTTAINCLVNAPNPKQEVVTVCDGITLTNATRTAPTTTAAPNNVTTTMAPANATNTTAVPTTTAVSNRTTTTTTTTKWFAITTNSTNTTTVTASSSFSFTCAGYGIHCDSIHALNFDNAEVVLSGKGSNLNNSLFAINNNLNVTMNDSASISSTTFRGVSMKNGSSVVIQIANGSQSISNSFLFDDVSSFQLINPDINALESKLLKGNNFIITNPLDEVGKSQAVRIENINGDMTNIFTTKFSTAFTLNCSNNQSTCGNIGTIDLTHVHESLIWVDKGVDFRSTVLASTVHVHLLNVTVLEGGTLSGVTINADYITKLFMNISGGTRGQNIIQAPNALGLDIYCNNPKSCSQDLQIHTSPSRTKLYCNGTACDMMWLFVNGLPDELTFYMSNCPCEEERHNLCISQWNISCGHDTAPSVLTDAICTGKCCGSLVTRLQETFPNKYECPLSTETSYVCQENKDCVVSCTNVEQYDRASPFKCSSRGEVNAMMAKSLQLFCGEVDATCAGLKLLAPAQQEKDDPDTDKFAQIVCTKNGCTDLNIDLMQTPNFYLDCSENSICSNITLINSKYIKEHMITPQINIYCSGGETDPAMMAICDGIGIVSEGANVSYVCRNSSCNNAYIYNAFGSTTLNVTGKEADFRHGSILGADMKFVAEIKNGKVSSTKMQLQPLGSHLIINNNGTINNVSINAHGANQFAFYCNGGCNETLDPNVFSLDDTKSVQIHVENDTMTGSNYNIYGNNISNLTFAAHANGVFYDFLLVNESSSHIELRCNEDGQFNRFNISSTDIYSVYVENYMGVINELSIEPDGSNKSNEALSTWEKVAVNILGTLSNSTIDATLAHNLSLVCSNKLGKTEVDGNCSNLTISIPVGINAVSSLSCQNTGCQSLTFYTVNGMNDLNVTLEECPCKSAIKDSCVASENEWNIYCEEENGPSVFKENRCEGGCCGNIVKDFRVKQCDYSGGGGKTHHHVGGVVAGICGAILALVVIVAAVYYYKKRKAIKRAEQEALLNVNN